MNKEIISEALNYIDDSLLEQTDRLRNAPRSQKIRNIRWVKYASLVAAATVVLVVGSVTIGNLGGAKNHGMKAESTNQMMMATDRKENAQMDGVINDSKTSVSLFDTDTVISMSAPTLAPGSAILNDSGSSEAVFETEEVFDNAINDYTFTVGGLTNSYIPKRSDIDCEVVKVSSDMIRILVFNNTEEAVFYGEDYELEKNNGEEWSSCIPADNVGFDAIAYNLEAGAEKELTINFSYVYGTLEPGQYRVIKRFTPRDLSSSLHDVITASVEFEIK